LDNQLKILITGVLDTAATKTNLASALKGLNGTVTVNTGAATKSMKVFNAEIEKSIAGNKLSSFFRINTVAAKKYENQMNTLKGSLSKVTNANELKSWNKEFTNLTGKIKASGDLGSGVFESVTKNAKKFFAWILSSGGIMAVVGALKGIVTNVKNIDLQMTELKKVTDETDQAYSNFLDNASKKAVELGSKISDLVSATAEFARLGYSTDDAFSLAEVATIYKNVGDNIGSISEASGVLISSLKAFNISADESIRLVDALNLVGNKYAIGSNDLGQALQRSASALASANNTYEESLGLITSAYEIVQNAEVVGTAIKTISMRLRNSAGDLEKYGEDADGAAESVTKLQEQVKDLSGVDIMIDKDNFKSTYQVIKELSLVWDKLTDKTQADLTRLISGQRQGNVFGALVSNMKNGVAATETALNSAGKQNCQYVQKCA